jgi:hypothetical protein
VYPKHQLVDVDAGYLSKMMAADLLLLPVREIPASKLKKGGSNAAAPAAHAAPEKLDKSGTVGNDPSKGKEK